MARIYLIGARGSGKSVTGMKLAQALQISFCDLDIYLWEHVGKSITQIVEEQGWDAFRKLESDILRLVTKKRENMVVATGGGIVLSADNRRYMADHGSIVWLNAPANILAERLAANPLNAQRPSLTGKGLIEEIQDILNEREHLYRNCAHFTVDASLPMAEVCETIFHFVKPEIAK